MKVQILLLLLLTITLHYDTSSAGDLIKQVALQKEAATQQQRKALNASDQPDISARITWQLNGPARITVMICDLKGNIVATPVDREEQPAGLHTFIWNGRDQQDTPCSPGLYFPVIRAKSATLGIDTYNPTAEPWGEAVDVHAFSFDDKAQVIRYTINNHVMVRIRVGEKDGGPFHKTVAAWKLRAPGTYEEPWDGMDSTRLIHVAGKEKFQIAFDAYTVPEKAVLIPVSKGVATVTAEKSYQKYPVHPPHGKRLAHYSLVPAGMTPDLDISATIPGSVVDQDGVVQLIGNQELQLTLSNGSPPPTVDERFELYLYVDGKMMYEIPTGSLPASINFETSKVANGLHMVTLNLITSEHRTGSTSFRVMITN